MNTISDLVESARRLQDRSARRVKWRDGPLGRFYIFLWFSFLVCCAGLAMRSKSAEPKPARPKPVTAANKIDRYFARVEATLARIEAQTKENPLD